jgi:SPP1 gp7 family putative phage head morphogenesis protein
MATLTSLEIQMDSVIRTGLREAMQHVDVMDRRDPLREVNIRLYSYLYESLHDQVLKTHIEGYSAGGDLIRRAGVKVDWSPLGDAIEYEDPLIAEMAKAAIAGLEELLAGQADTILEVIVAEYEKGSSITTISKRLVSYFDDDRVAATRFARTFTNAVYNQANLKRYEDSGVVDGVQFSAHIDNVTSEVCKMLNGTIWALGDPEIRVPPLHFNCRSDLLPYFGKIPGDRDFTKEFGSEFVESATETADTFRSKYWGGISAAMDSADHVALKRELATFRRLLSDRHPASKVKVDRTVDDAYAQI